MRFESHILLKNPSRKIFQKFFTDPPSRQICRKSRTLILRSKQILLLLVYSLHAILFYLNLQSRVILERVFKLASLGEERASDCGVL